MEITFADSFFDSLKKLARHNSWWYKTYSFLRYDIFRFFKNIILFRKELYGFYPWDSSCNLNLFKKSLEITADNLEKYGYEIEISRNKKVKSIKRVIELLDHSINEDFIDQAEKELGYEIVLSDIFSSKADKRTPEEKENCDKIYKLSDEIQKQQWEELWSIIKGNYDFKIGDDWDEKFNGSDIRGWWD